MQIQGLKDGGAFQVRARSVACEYGARRCRSAGVMCAGAD